MKPKEFDSWEADLCSQALEHWDVDSQVLMAMEELAELQVELAKSFRRVNSSCRDGILEELADVDIMMHQLRILYGISDGELRKVKERKLKRLEERLK